MKRKNMLTFKVIAGIACFLGFLTISSEFSRSQSEKPEMRTAWNPGKNVLLATAVPVAPKPLQLNVPEFVVKETQQITREEKKEKIETPFAVIDSVTKPPQAEKISAQEITPRILKVREPAQAREERTERRTAKPMTGQVPIPKLSPPLLLNHTELQAMVNYLDYEILPGRGVRFRYNELLYERMGHEWFLKRPRDLRGKTVRIDYRGYVPREMAFRVARSGTSAAVIKKVKLEDAPYETRSILIEIPSTIPFKEVKFLEFWIDRESAGRNYGDFMIEKVVVLGPFVPTNLMRAEVQAR